jgi:hypothetical protein
MKSACVIFFLSSLLTMGAKSIDQFPQAEISNGIIKARLYLPDADTGYYRGARFDWSGVVANLEYKDHTYFGQWFSKYSPTQHDAIMGPVEDFYPIGYDEAKAGESFVKIGIGALIKPEEPRYTFTNPYHIVDHGKWKMKAKKNQVEFVHKLEQNGYAYEYQKTLQLVKDKPQMVLSHSLRNTGSNIIETNVYNHNFFVIDGQPTGPDFNVQFTFNITGEPIGRVKVGELQQNQIMFTKELAKNEHLHYPTLSGFGNSAKDYDIRVENKKTGAAVRITSDQPLSKLVFWSAATTVCPEPYIHVSVKPGEVFRWKIFYEFYTIKK